MSQISKQYVDGLELRISELEAENESLRGSLAESKADFASIKAEVGRLKDKCREHFEQGLKDEKRAEAAESKVKRLTARGIHDMQHEIRELRAKLLAVEGLQPYSQMGSALIKDPNGHVILRSELESRLRGEQP